MAKAGGGWLLALLAGGAPACAEPGLEGVIGAPGTHMELVEGVARGPRGQDMAAVEEHRDPARPPPACARDEDCGYDPSSGRCGGDPRYNRQPPIVDQGIVCYCEARACATLRVMPVPCEGNADCAVQPSPRPHPARATDALPHERRRACRDVNVGRGSASAASFTLSTTCERTNICTMHRHRCAAP